MPAHDSSSRPHALTSPDEARPEDRLANPSRVSITSRLTPMPGLPWQVRLPHLTVIVPTRNEAPNIAPLLKEIALVGPAHVLFVDDSDDRTPQVIRGRSNAQVRLLHRPRNERAGGLGGAVRMGMDACSTRYCAVMDGDLQHPPSALIGLYSALEQGAELAIASRYVGDGDTGGLDGRVRQFVSRGSNALARALFPKRLHAVSDPMSGMFALDLSRVDVAAIRPDGFKVLLEILVLGSPARVQDVPYTFRDRQAGESKAGMKEGVTYLKRLLALRASAWTH
jgi:glycosyltransferase involved in cell wall biosynthesis